jgi:hypothetical protein
LPANSRYAVLRLGITLNGKPTPGLAHRHQLQAVDVDVRRGVEQGCFLDKTAAHSSKSALPASNDYRGDQAGKSGNYTFKRYKVKSPIC